MHLLPAHIGMSCESDDMGIAAYASGRAGRGTAISMLYEHQLSRCKVVALSQNEMSLLSAGQEMC